MLLFGLVHQVICFVNLLKWHLIAITLSLSTLGATSFNVGFIGFDPAIVEGNPGVAGFSINNLTGLNSNIDFPVLTEVAFNGTLTVTYCRANLNCEDVLNQQSSALVIPANLGSTQAFDPFFSGWVFPSDVIFRFSQSSFIGSVVIPGNAFMARDAQDVSRNYSLSSSSLDFSLSSTDPFIVLLTINGDEVVGGEIPEPATSFLLASGALMIVLRKKLS